MGGFCLVVDATNFVRMTKNQPLENSDNLKRETFSALP